MLKKTIVGCLLVLAACDWRAFEWDKQHAPAQVFGTPSALPSGQFGRSLVEVTPTSPSSSAALTVLANGVPGFATYTFDASGGTAMNAQVGANIAGLGDPSVTYGALAVGSNGTTVVVPVQALPPQLFPLDANAFTRTGNAVNVPQSAGAPQNNFGGSTVVGDLDGDGMDDWAVTSDETLTVVWDGATTKAPSQCTLPTSTAPPPKHGLALAALGGTGAMTLAVGVPGDTPPSVWLLSAADVTGGCKGTLTKISDATDADFGAAVAFAHLSSASAPDLVVGAPGANKALVYLNNAGAYPATPSTTLAPTDTANAGAFGASLLGIAIAFAPPEAGIVGNRTPDVLVIGDPQATVNGVKGAGVAHAYWGYVSAATPSLMEGATLYSRNPAVGDQLGLTLATLHYKNPAGGAALPVLVAGGSSSFTVYFDIGLPGEVDPRSF